MTNHCNQTVKTYDQISPKVQKNDFAKRTRLHEVK